MKSSKHQIPRIIVFLLVVAFAVMGVSYWWTSGLRPVESTDTRVTPFVISSGDGVREITANLARQDIIRDPIVFFLLVKFMGIERNIQAGDYQLSRSMDSATVARTLTHGISDTRVLIVEGLRNEEIAAILAAQLPKVDREDFLNQARQGYMFPATYDFPKDATSGAVVQRLTETFDRQITDRMREDAAGQGLSLEEVVIMASIVEKEAYEDDKRMIAGILLKRLRAGWPLQVDATLSYIIDPQFTDNTWWKHPVLPEHKEIRSPYNTYLNTGLPPGPISNPGKQSIEAVIYPEESEYWYYIHDTNNQVYYARTLEEHNANIAAYLR